MKRLSIALLFVSTCSFAQKKADLWYLSKDSAIVGEIIKANIKHNNQFKSTDNICVQAYNGFNSVLTCYSFAQVDTMKVNSDGTKSLLFEAPKTKGDYEIFVSFGNNRIDLKVYDPINSVDNEFDIKEVIEVKYITPQGVELKQPQGATFELIYYRDGTRLVRPIIQ